MKKSKYGLISAILIIAMILGQTTTARGTTYTCTGVVGAQAIWRVKTVNSGALTDIFGASPIWETFIDNSFGPGANQSGARMKTVVTLVNTSVWMTPPIGLCEFCLITSDVWWWTTSPFANTSDSSGVPTMIWMHPENLTTYVQFISGGMLNVSQVSAFPFLNALPVPAATYLSELVWDKDYSISGTTVTHNVAAGYMGLAGPYNDNCTETWRYSNEYGTFLGYRLVHENGTTAYETELEVAPGIIPGFELPIVIGVSMGLTIGLIFVIMKKKK